MGSVQARTTPTQHHTGTCKCCCHGTAANDQYQHLPSVPMYELQCPAEKSRPPSIICNILLQTHLEQLPLVHVPLKDGCQVGTIPTQLMPPGRTMHVMVIRPRPITAARLRDSMVVKSSKAMCCGTVCSTLDAWTMAVRYSGTWYVVPG